MYNIRFTLLVLFCILSKLTHAQSADSHSKREHELNISFSFGAAIPIGGFSEFETRDQNTTPTDIIGGAKTGINGKIEGQYYLTKKFGFVVNAGFISSKVDAITFDELYPDKTRFLGGGSSSVSFDYSSTSWEAINLMGGVTTRFEFGNVKMDLKIFSGYQQLKFPEIEINEKIYWWIGAVDSGTDTRKSFQPGLIAENLALDLGADLKVNVLKNVEFLLSVDYILSYPQYKSRISYTYERDQSSPAHSEFSVESDFYKSNSFVYLNFGVNFKLY